MRITIVQNDLDFIAGALTVLGIPPQDCIIVSDEPPQTKVFRYEWNVDAVHGDLPLLERLFGLFNADDKVLPTCDPRRKICDQFRQAGMRSLSVGDVVWLDGRGYRCMPQGWTPVH